MNKTTSPHALIAREAPAVSEDLFLRRVTAEDLGVAATFDSFQCVGLVTYVVACDVGRIRSEARCLARPQTLKPQLATSCHEASVNFHIEHRLRPIFNTWLSLLQHQIQSVENRCGEPDAASPQKRHLPLEDEISCSFLILGSMQHTSTAGSGYLRKLEKALRSPSEFDGGDLLARLC